MTTRLLTQIHYRYSLGQCTSVRTGKHSLARLANLAIVPKRLVHRRSTVGIATETRRRLSPSAPRGAFTLYVNDPAFVEHINTTGSRGSWGRFPAQLDRAQLNNASPPRRLRTPWRSRALSPSNLVYSWSKSVRLSQARRMAMRIGALCTPA